MTYKDLMSNKDIKIIQIYKTKGDDNDMYIEYNENGKTHYMITLFDNNENGAVHVYSDGKWSNTTYSKKELEGLVKFIDSLDAVSKQTEDQIKNSSELGKKINELKLLKLIKEANFTNINEEKPIELMSSFEEELKLVEELSDKNDEESIEIPTEIKEDKKSIEIPIEIKEENSTEFPVEFKETETKEKTISSKNIVVGLVVALATTATILTAGFSLIKNLKSNSNNNDNDNNKNKSISAYVRDIEENEILFDVEKEGAKISKEVYNDLNANNDMTTPATTEKGALKIDPNAIIDGTNKIDINKLVNLYNITETDVLIMLLVANDLNPYEYGFNEKEVMNSITSGPVQAAHAGGIESVAGAIDNPEYNPYLIERRNKELLPQIFSNKYDKEFVTQISESKTAILDQAYNGKSVDNIKLTIEKSLEDVVKYVILSEPITFKDGTTGCFESINPFAQYVALSYAYSTLSVSSVAFNKVVYKDQIWTIDSIAESLAKKTNNSTAILGEMYTSSSIDCTKVKTLS